MSSIRFFDPVVYSHKDKTLPQQFLEAVDEYCYLGDRFRVSISSRTSQPPLATLEKQNSPRSWLNIAIKVATYCTIIIPLIALATKAILRCHLRISSITLTPHAPRAPIFTFPDFTFPEPRNYMEKVLFNKDSFNMIRSFLSYSDQQKLAEAAKFTAASERRYISIMAGFKEEFNKLSANSSDTEAFDQLLVKLVISVAIGDRHWVPVMKAWMIRFPFDDMIDSSIQQHARIAGLLARSKPPISPNNLYQFCRYLGEKQLSRWNPWVGYRYLEKYSLGTELDQASINKAIKEYLTQAAEEHINAALGSRGISNNQILNFQKVDIDPRLWFGSKGNNNSLWSSPDTENRETASMPKLLLEVLLTRIKSLHDSCKDKPFMVSMTGRQEAELPRNFTLELAQGITKEKIFLDHNNTIDIEEIESEMYGRSILSLNTTQTKELAEDYPDAITSRLR